MKCKPLRIGLVALVVLSVVSLRVQAQANVLQQIPDSALAYAVIKNMDQANDLVLRQLQRMQLPKWNALQTAKQRMNLVRGIVETGDVAVVILSDGNERPFPVLLLPVDNYDQLLGQLSPTEQEASISRVTLGNWPRIVARKGNYAALAPADKLAEFKQFLAAQQSVKIEEDVAAFLARTQAYAVVTEAGVKTISQRVIEGLREARDQFAQMGSQGEAVVAGLGIYEQMFTWAAAEVEHVVLALEMEDSGNVALRKRVAFQNPVDYAGTGSAAGATKRLARLPEWPYVMAFAGTIGDSPAMEKWMQLSMQMMRVMVGPQQLSDEQIKKLLDASRQTMQGVRGMSFVFGVPTDGGTVYSRMGMAMDVDDAAAYVERYLQATQQMKNIFGGNEAMPYRILKAEKVEIDGVQGAEIQMQILPVAAGPGAEQAEELFGKLFGEGGKITVYAMPVGTQHVAIAYESKDNLRQVAQAIESTDQGLGAAAEIQTTAKLLPKEAQWVGYLDPQGTLQYVQWAIKLVVPPQQQQQVPEIPAFPASPPLGVSVQFDGQVLVAGLFVPVDFLTALGQYIRAFRQ